jgi:hypothetical protein
MVKGENTAHRWCFVLPAVERRRRAVCAAASRPPRVVAAADGAEHSGRGAHSAAGADAPSAGTVATLAVILPNRAGVLGGGLVPLLGGRGRRLTRPGLVPAAGGAAGGTAGFRRGALHQYHLAVQLPLVEVLDAPRGILRFLHCNEAVTAGPRMLSIRDNLRMKWTGIEVTVHGRRKTQAHIS